MATRSTITPVLPGELRALVPTGQDSLREVLRKWFKFQLLLYRWHRYAFLDGDFTDAFKDELCYALSFCGDEQTSNPNSPFYEPDEEE